MENIKRSGEMLALIVACGRVYPYCLTYREIGLHLGILSTSHVEQIILKLEGKELIRRIPRQARTLHATEKGKLNANIGLVGAFERELNASNAIQRQRDAE